MRADTIDEKDERLKGTHYASEAAAHDLPVGVKRQAKALIAYDEKEHTEDCADANDDTSVLKGKCICPKAKKEKVAKEPKAGPKTYHVRLKIESDLSKERVIEWIQTILPTVRVRRIREVI